MIRALKCRIHLKGIKKEETIISRSIKIYGFEFASRNALQEEQRVRFPGLIHGTWPQSIDSEDISGPLASISWTASFEQT